MTQTGTVKVASDAWVDSGHVGANHGSTPKLKVNASGSGAERRAFLHTSLPFRAGATVTQAILHLYLTGADMTGQTITVKRITSKWREDRVNWHTRPSVTSTNSVSAAVDGAAAGDEAVSTGIDITDIINDVADGSTDWQGLQITIGDDDTTKDYSFHSGESTQRNVRPAVDFEWALIPDGPDNLVPDSGDYVNLTSPVLCWARMASPDKRATQAQVRLQIDTDDTFPTPVYDSGTVAHVRSQFDLANPPTGAPAFGGLSSDTTYFWRVRVIDDAGNVSAWSDAAEFVQHAFPALTITTPGAPASDYVESSTPNLAWTFSDQVAYRIVIEMRNVAEDDWVRLPNDVDDWTRGDDQFHELEDGVITRTNRTHRITIHTRDSYTRAATPGDPGYATARREFTIQEGATDPVEAILAVNDLDTPSILIKWFRTLTPDKFEIIIDPGTDERVTHVVDPAVAAYGPETIDMVTYTFKHRYWGATPGSVHTIGVRAIEDDVSSTLDVNSTFDATLRPDGTWLVCTDVDPNVLVVLAEVGKRSDRELAIGEDTTQFNVVGSRAPVLLTGSIRGYEGKIGGKLGPVYGFDADELRDNLERLKGLSRNHEVRLLMQGLNIPVQLGKVTITPTTIANLYDVTIEVVQIGDFFDLEKSRHD